MLDWDWNNLWSIRTVINVIDIAIVTVFMYQLLKITRNSRVTHILKGVGFILLVKFVSSFLQFQTTEYIVDFVIQWAAIALIVIFQPELRRALEHLGRGSVFNRQKGRDPNIYLVEEIIEATQYMGKRKIGALIAIEKEVDLQEYIKTGVPLGSEISSELLINIFIPNAPLHDGAVIIKDMEVASASSYLPLSESPTIPKRLGTRHRAAIGLSEVTDAITVVVSEETGGVSVTKSGNILTELNQEDLYDYLINELVPEEEEENFFEDLMANINGWFEGGSEDEK